VSDIDWNLELRKIEREYDGLPPERSRTQIRMQRIREVVAKDRLAERLSVVGIWLRLVLVAALTASVFWWPYGRDCGLPFVAFLSANAMVIIGAFALAARTWRDRMAWPFMGSALCAVVAWTTIAMHTLPRLGYSPLGGMGASWSCTTHR
jgi:cytochrome bd-type quinol oxidase subunit 2